MFDDRHRDLHTSSARVVTNTQGLHRWCNADTITAPAMIAAMEYAVASDVNSINRRRLSRLFLMIGMLASTATSLNTEISRVMCTVRSMLSETATAMPVSAAPITNPKSIS